MAIVDVLSRRQNGQEGIAGSTKVIIGLSSFVVVFTLICLTYIGLARLRQLHSEPKYLPTQFLKSRWRRWHPKRRKQNLTARMHVDESAPTLYLRRQHAHLEDSDQHETLQHSDATVERHASIRSVATLPAYSKSVRENEQVLGREGERAGVDIVLEAPETAAEEEARREEEMSSLHNIREQRRRELAEREDRRRRRREARERGDVETYRAIRAEALRSAQERETSGAAALIAEHQSRSRERRVSSVSYADLGVARHDGSRVRAGSASSDRQPLLDSAASISGLSMAPPALTRDSLSTHTRGRSSTSILSGISSDVDSENDMPPFGRAGSDFEIVTLNQGHSRNGSRAITPSGQRSRASSAAHRLSIDTTADRHIPHDPPAYDGAGFEEAPAYISPASERAKALAMQNQISPETEPSSGAPSLPEISRLPSIRIAEATPIEPRQPHDYPTQR